MADIKCPVCGQVNPADADTCSNCGAFLQETIQPGQPPTKKVTAELEPILPEWLRAAREKARKSIQSENEDLPQSKPPTQPASDLLAGLQAQSEAEDDEEIPDWLAGITGSKGKKKTPPEQTGPRRVEVGRPGDFPEETRPTAAQSRKPPQPSQPEPPQAEPPSSEGDSDLPAWLSALATPPQEESQGTKDLQNWFEQAASSAAGEPVPPVEAEMPPASEVPSEAEPALPPSGGLPSMDWLNRLKGEAEEPPQSSQEMPPASPTAGESDLPEWLREEGSSASDLPEWLRGLGAQPPAEAPASPVEPPAEVPASEEPLSDDWLAQLRAETPASPEPEPDIAAPLESGDVPDWLKAMQAGEAPAEHPPAAPDKFTAPQFPPRSEQGDTQPVFTVGHQDELPDWLKATREEAEEASLEEPPAQQQPAVSPDWFAELTAQTPAEAEPELPPGMEPGELPDWLKSLEPQATAPAQPEMLEPAPADQIEQSGKELPELPATEPLNPVTLDVDLPDWLQDMGKQPEAAPKEEPETPDWLSSLGAPASSSPAFTQEPPVEVGKLETPDWLADLRPSPHPAKPAAPDEPPPEEPAPESAQPFFTGEPLASGELESLLTDVPDWLAESTSPAPLPAETPPPAAEGEALSPAELPSWVQAMRPVEAMLGAAAAESSDQELESAGPLAGLRGVLPAVAYSGASSKPEAYSIKLQASEEQQTHAGLLEQILAAEAHPEPMAVAPRLAAGRGLRIALGVLIFLAVLAGVLFGAQAFPMPVVGPDGVGKAVEAVDAVPANSPVLVVFDYEPALAGEMEAAAAPLLDHLIVRSHPRLTLISTSPTGAALADRLFSGPLHPLVTDLGYNSYTNLGYLPGGLGGVRTFAQNPVAAMPLAADSTAVNWGSGVTEGVQQLSSYSAIIVITDGLEAGRAWIEQTQGLRGNTPLLVVSSAQAGPMLQPYYHSGQIGGLVTGLSDAALVEQTNANRPGLARRYWDAYNLALIVALIVILAGAAWNLVVGLRERAATEVS